jgi:hypothetical protein
VAGGERRHRPPVQLGPHHPSVSTENPHAALEGALALQALGPEALDVELVAPERDFTHRPMLVAEPFGHGSVRTFPLKQGGIAAQQADAAAESTAVRAGAAVDPQPFRPVLRGLLLTGMVPRFLRAEPGTPASAVDTEPLWWPPAKIVGRHLAPFLAEHLALSELLPDAARESAIPIEVELTPENHGVWSEV